MLLLDDAPAATDVDNGLASLSNDQNKYEDLLADFGAVKSQENVGEGNTELIPSVDNGGGSSDFLLDLDLVNFKIAPTEEQSEQQPVDTVAPDTVSNLIC